MGASFVDLGLLDAGSTSACALTQITPPAPTYESLNIPLRKPQSKVLDNVKTPYELFILSITSEDYEKLSNLTNLYTQSQRIERPLENQARPWVNTTSSEMKSFIGTTIIDEHGPGSCNC